MATVALAALAGWLGTQDNPSYTFQSTIYLGQGTAQDRGEDRPGRGSLDRRAATFAGLVPNAPLVADAVERAGVDRSPEEVVEGTGATAEEGTDLVRIFVTDEDSAVAETLANALAEVTVDHAASGFALSGDPVELPSSVTVVAPASFFAFFSDTSPPPRARNALVAAAFGALVAVALALALEYLDVRAKGPADVERRLNLPVLGAIPRADPAGTRADA